jgi:hypothetical protein
MPITLAEFVRDARRQILREASVEEILEAHPPEQLLDGLTPEQRLEGLSLEQRLRGLSPDQRECLLRQFAEEALRTFRVEENSTN